MQQTWDELIQQRKIHIDKLAEYMDVSPKYLKVNTEFMKAVMIDNKYLAKQAIQKAIDRYNEFFIEHYIKK